MPRPAKSRLPLSSRWFFLFLALFSLQVVPRFWLDSISADEAIETTNGYYYWVLGDVASAQVHPPLSSALQSLPLVFMDLKTTPYPGDYMDRASRFFFINNADKLESMTLAARVPVFLMGCLVGFLLWRLTRSQAPALGLFALGLWAFEPTLLAMSGLAKNDVAATLFFLLSVLAFQGARERPGWKPSLLAGLVTGMAMTAKYSNGILLVVFLFLDWWDRRKYPGAPLRWASGAAGALLWITFLYLPGTLLLPDHRLPWTHFLDKLGGLLEYGSRPHPVFFLGTASLENHWAYFPTAFLLKSSLPFLLLLATGLALAWRNKIQVPTWQWAPPLIFSLAVLPAQNIGIRYLLPAYPFFILLAARGGQWLLEKSRGRGLGPLRTLALGLLAWHAGSVLLNFPRHVSYFNDLVPPSKKISLLGDSNLEFDQDLKRLARWAGKRGWERVKLAYTGGVDPALYGLEWEAWRERDLAGPQPGWVYLVNVNFIQLGPVWFPSARTIMEGWISELPPTGKLGDTWYYFEVPGKPVADPSPFILSVPYLQSRGYAPAP